MHVEIEWLIHQTTGDVVPGVRALTADESPGLRRSSRTSDREVAELAEIERVTVHDVKAVEYFLKERLREIAPADEDKGLAELIHFGCTSEDINNLSYALMVKGRGQRGVAPPGDGARRRRSRRWREAQGRPAARPHPRPARHADDDGQGARRPRAPPRPAAAAHRGRQEYLGKFNGATGTYGAHALALPDVDWPAVSRAFVEGLGLTWNPLTTQIESHDWQAELYADVARFNRILHNLCTDVWTYISMGYFAQVRGPGHRGLEHDAAQGQPDPLRERRGEPRGEQRPARRPRRHPGQSRLQRDLTDSSMQRNIGSAFGHSLLALDNVARGLAGLDAVPERMAADLEANWEVLGEADPVGDAGPGRPGRPRHGEPYERLKELTRGRRIDGDDLRAFVRGLGLPADVEARFVALTPQTYTALAGRLVDDYLA